MAFKFLDRVLHSVSGSPGTGVVVLSGPLAGYQSFTAAGAKNGDTFSYLIVDGLNWEYGVGTLNIVSGNPQVTRTTVTQTSNNNTTPISVSSKANISAVLRAEDIPQGGVSYLSGLLDVAVVESALADDDVLKWNTSTQKWVGGTGGGGSGDDDYAIYADGVRFSQSNTREVNFTGVTGPSYNETTGVVTIPVESGIQGVAVSQSGTLKGAEATSFNFVGPTVTYDDSVATVTVSGGGGSSTLSGLSDVNVTEGSAIDDALLYWNNGASKWEATLTPTLTNLTTTSSTAGAVGVTTVNTTTSGATGGTIVVAADVGAAVGAAGVRLGGIQFRGSIDGAHTLTGSDAIVAYSTQAWVDGSAYGSQLAFRTTANNGTTIATVMTLDQSGFVGLGSVTTPINGLDLPASYGIHIANGVPSNTANALYSISGNLYWNGAEIGGGGSSTLSGLSDVNVTEGSAIDSALLYWNNAAGKWEATLNPAVTTLVIQDNADDAIDYLLRLTSVANPTGTSRTSIKIEKGTGYGGIVSGYIDQGVGGGLILSAWNASTADDAVNIHPNGLTEIIKGLILDNNVPATTTNALYNDAGALYWNGTAVGSGGGGSGAGFPYFSPPTASWFDMSQAYQTTTCANVTAVGMTMTTAFDTNDKLACGRISTSGWTAPWSVTARMRLSHDMWNSYAGFGLFAWDSASARICGITMQSLSQSAQIYATTNEWNSPTSKNGTGVQDQLQKMPEWFRISYDGTNVIYSYSHDGQNWSNYSSPTASGFITGAPSYVGIGLENNFTTSSRSFLPSNVSVTCDYWSDPTHPASNQNA